MTLPPPPHDPANPSGGHPPLAEFCAQCEEVGECPIAYVGNCLPFFGKMYIPKG